MSRTITPDGNKITGIFCNFFGHHFVVSKKVTEHIKEYRCVHCQKQVTTDERGKLSPLTQKLREINNTLEDMYQRRRRIRAAGKPMRKRGLTFTKRIPALGRQRNFRAIPGD